LTKLQKLLKSIVKPGSIVQYILCRWEDAQKSIVSTLKMLQKRVWKGAGALRQDSTSAYSEMPGELDQVVKYKNKQHEQAMKAEIKDPSDDLRKAGL